MNNKRTSAVISAFEKDLEWHRFEIDTKEYRAFRKIGGVSIMVKGYNLYPTPVTLQISDELYDGFVRNVPQKRTTSIYNLEAVIPETPKLTSSTHSPNDTPLKTSIFSLLSSKQVSVSTNQLGDSGKTYLGKISNGVTYFSSFKLGEPYITHYESYFTLLGDVEKDFNGMSGETYGENEDAYLKFMSFLLTCHSLKLPMKFHETSLSLTR